MDGEKCAFCGGKLVRRKKPFVVETNGQRLLIEDVPCFECAECGLTTVVPLIMNMTRKIGRAFREGKLEIQKRVTPTVKYGACLGLK